MNVLAICWIILKLKIQLGRGGGGGGQVVSVLALYSNNPSSNPAEAYSFFRKFMFGKNENKQKDAPFGLGTPTGLFLKLWVNHGGLFHGVVSSNSSVGY